MTQEETIFQIANLTANIGAIQELLIQKKICTRNEIDSLVKESLIIGKKNLLAMSDDTVNFDVLSNLITDEINKL